MLIQNKQQIDFIRMVAIHLAKIFMKPLLEFNKEKNYPAQVGGLAEILDWSREFYEQYYDKITNWEIFRCSSYNIYNAGTPGDLIDAFGRERFNKFCAQNKSHTAYFTEKYSAIKL
jgi:hypothetical protein